MFKKAFTILELLVVISVLVILLGIAIPRFKGMQDNANVVKTKSELKTVQAALESYYTFNRSYPANIGAALLAATPKILPALSQDPFNGNAEFHYFKSDDGKYYVVFSAGLVGEGGTDTSDHQLVDAGNGACSGGDVNSASLPGEICVSNAVSQQSNGCPIQC